MLRLSDIIGRVSPSALLVVAALVIFALVFVGVAWYAMFFLSKDAVQHFSSLPLDDEPRPDARSEKAI